MRIITPKKTTALVATLEVALGASRGIEEAIQPRLSPGTSEAAWRAGACEAESGKEGTSSGFRTRITGEEAGRLPEERSQNVKNA
ncbi:hypothetical protein Y1Q_0020658 [Alligator mississippiensis]|uniref:Uncharacterized protein n=1 Tax=Alligator mississippiensis TaxID=8496 RepID=A0A151NH67_ALLMI|nr:hypothetical protein Y1Q_0020658 [Alligator mississippiensis]